jgi:hypothetical protein
MADLFHLDSDFRWNDLVHVNFQQKWLKPSSYFFTRILHVKNDLLFDGWMTYWITRFLLYSNYFFVEGMGMPTHSRGLSQPNVSHPIFKLKMNAHSIYAQESSLHTYRTGNRYRITNVTIYNIYYRIMSYKRLSWTLLEALQRKDTITPQPIDRRQLLT